MKEEKSKRMFKSNVLDRLTRVHPAIAILYNITCSSSLLYLNYRFKFVTGVGLIIGIFFLGVAFWTLSEYLLHRFFFHITKEQSVFFSKISHTVHGVHHEQPTDYKRMFMPPVPTTLFMIIFFGLFYVVMGSRVFVFLPGFLSGYLGYAYTHFKIHQSKPPKHLKWLWTHHLKHHYQSDEKAFGVSSPFWDVVFRSLPAKNGVGVSKKDESEEEEKKN